MIERLKVRCALESRAHDEPLHGTASRVRRWLVIEQPGPWGREAVVESRLDHTVGLTLRSAGRRLGIRVLLVRRPGWQHPDVHRVYLASSGRDRWWLEQLDLDSPRALLDLDLDALASREPPGVGVPGPPSIHLVCTNGRHDPCCADFGRPVVRALLAAGTPDVWESSHVGGDRFAANVVCLPHGVYFGRVDPDLAPGLLDDFRRGLLDLDHYRGRSPLPPLLQSAEVYARRELGERNLDGLRVTDTTPLGGGALAATFRDADGRHVDVEVYRRRADDAAPLTCGADTNQHPWRYLLRSLTVR